MTRPPGQLRPAETERRASALGIPAADKPASPAVAGAESPRATLYSVSPWGSLSGAPLCALDHLANMFPDYDGVLVLCEHGALEDKALRQGTPVRCFPFLFMGLRRAKPLLFLKNVRRVVASRVRYVVGLGRCLKHRPGILHIHSRAVHLPYALLAGRLAGVPVVMTLHEPWAGGLEGWWQLALVRLFRVPVVCLTRAMVSQYPRLLRAAAIIPNALTSMPPPGPRKPGPAHRPVVGMVAAMMIEKGVDLCLETCRVLKERGVSFTLRLVGRWDRGEIRREADAFIARHGLERCVDICGEIHSPEGIYGDLDILFLPTRRDSFPRVVMEAMSWGIPAVATRVDGIPEMVADGETGLLAAPGDVQGFADALQRLIGDVPLREEMGRKARERAERLFSPEAYREKFKALYASLPPVRPPAAGKGRGGKE